MYFDSHTHINNEEYTPGERKAVIEAIEASDVDTVIDIGFDLTSSRMAVDHANRYSWCYAAVGCHPHNAEGMTEERLNLIRELAMKDKVVAIGEIGLDFHYDLSPRGVQREWFRKQIRLALELKKPISIHAREADGEVMEILTEEEAFSEERKSCFPKLADGAGDARVLLHCFSGSKELALEYVKKGATISIAGPVTYKNNKKTVAVVEALPSDRILAETDAPYLTPVPFRGKPNMSPYIEHTIRRIGVIRGITVEEAAVITKANARRFFGIGE